MPNMSGTASTPGYTFERQRLKAMVSSLGKETAKDVEKDAGRPSAGSPSRLEQLERRRQQAYENFNERALREVERQSREDALAIPVTKAPCCSCSRVVILLFVCMIAFLEIDMDIVMNWQREAFAPSKKLDANQTAALYQVQTSLWEQQQEFEAEVEKRKYVKKWSNDKSTRIADRYFEDDAHSEVLKIKPAKKPKWNKVVGQTVKGHNRYGPKYCFADKVLQDGSWGDYSEWQVSQDAKCVFDHATEKCLEEGCGNIVNKGWERAMRPEWQAKLEGKKLVFLGDAQMHAFARAFALSLAGCQNVRHSRTRVSKDAHDYLDLRRKKGKIVQLDNEGPVTSDAGECNTCNAFIYKCAQGVQLEYFPMQFAQDVIISTKKHRTTQENLFLDYFAPEENKNGTALVGDNKPDVIFMNSGLHDLKLLNKGWTTEDGARNYFDMMRTNYETLMAVTGYMRKHMTKLIWISNTHIHDIEVPGHQKSYVKDENIFRLNEITHEVMKYGCDYVLDPYYMTYKGANLYNDFVHLHNKDDIYYKTLVDISMLVLDEFQIYNPGYDYPKFARED